MYFAAKQFGPADLRITVGRTIKVTNIIPIVLILFGSTLMTRAIYKSTKNPYIADIINAIIVGLLTITNTCTVFVG